MADEGITLSPGGGGCLVSQFFWVLWGFLGDRIGGRGEEGKKGGLCGGVGCWVRGSLRGALTAAYYATTRTTVAKAERAVSQRCVEVVNANAPNRRSKKRHRDHLCVEGYISI